MDCSTWQRLVGLLTVVVVGAVVQSVLLLLQEVDELQTTLQTANDERTLLLEQIDELEGRLQP